MARVIPRISIDEIPLKPERDVARALVGQLSDECIIYHSYPWLKPDRNDRTNKITLKEGETDFVIIMPGHGMLVLEVKGGEVFYDETTAKWARKLHNGSVREIRDPFEQVRRNTHYLKDRILQLGYPGALNPPFAYGYAVVFPDCEFHGPTPPGSDAAVIFAASDLPYLGRRVPTLIAKWATKEKLPTLDDKALEVVQRAITPAFKLLPVLFRQIEDQEQRLVRLTEHQLLLLDFLANRNRAAVEGIAGSGKTLLAQAQTQRFAECGKRVLFVCYNKALAAWLQSRTPDHLTEKITITHFHALCASWCQKADVKFVPSGKDQQTFWKEEAALLLLEAIETLAERYDAVVVDEGQDFCPDWWSPLEQINAAGAEGIMYVFYDPAQNLFVSQGVDFPDLGAPYPLPTNCRNTRKIALTCEEIIGRSVPTREDAPEGIDTRYISVTGREKEREAIKDVLDEWIRKGRLSMSQIAVLSPNRYRNSVVTGITGARVPIIEDHLDWRDDRGVLFSSIRAFKGLEADAVLMVDVRKPDSSPIFTKTDYYVGCSRAKHLLAVIQQSV